MQIHPECYHCLEQQLRVEINSDFNRFFDERHGYNIFEILAKLKAYKYLKEKCSPVQGAERISLFAIMQMARYFYVQS